MAEPMEPVQLPRRVLIVLYTLATMTRGGATYRGLAYALGMNSERSVQRSVACAQELGLVKVTHTGAGMGRGHKAVIQIQNEGFRLLSKLRH